MIVNCCILMLVGGNSKTAMVAAISPADINYEETLSTLRHEALISYEKFIKTQPVILALLTFQSPSAKEAGTIVTPDLRLPSQPQSITTHWLVPNYTAWWQRHMFVKNLPRVALDNGVAGIWTRDLLITSPLPYRYTTEPQILEHWLLSEFI